MKTEKPEPPKTPESLEEDEDRDFLTAYARDSSVEFLPAQKGVGTLGIDLEKGKVHVDVDFWEKLGYEPRKKLFCKLHEIGHFCKLRTLLNEKGGDKIWKKHRDKINKNRHYGILDNTWEDVSINREVVSRAPVMAQTREDLYTENLFPNSDLTVTPNGEPMPKHLQFTYALLRERQVPGQKCQVDEDVRKKIDRLEGVKSKSGVPLLEYASRPDIAPSTRIALQEKYLEPVYERFFKEDVEKKKQEEKDKKDQKGDKGDKDDKGEKGEKGEKQEGESGEGGGNEGEEEQDTPQDEPGEKEKGKPQEKSKPGKPEDYFSDEYDEFDKNNPDHALPDKEIEKAVKDFLEAKKKKGKEKSQEELLLEAYAKEAGVTVDDLKTYQNFWSGVEGIENPETNERVIEELREIFRKIIAERLVPRLRSKQPTTEGEILVRHAEAVASIKVGIQEPAVWETLEVRSRNAEHFGNFDVTLVADRSDSMNEADENGVVKNIEQRKAVALLLEALTEFSRELEDVRHDLLYDLHVRTEAWAFGGDAEIGILKPLSETLTGKERVAVYKTLGDTPGEATKDFIALRRIKNSIPEEDWQALAEKKLRKIIIVLSDGESNDGQRNTANKVKKVCKELRERGVIVVGVGITKSGEPIRTTYALDGRVSEKAADLGSTLGELLKEYLKDL